MPTAWVGGVLSGKCDFCLSAEISQQLFNPVNTVQTLYVDEFFCSSTQKSVRQHFLCRHNSSIRARGSTRLVQNLNQQLPKQTIRLFKWAPHTFACYWLTSTGVGGGGGKRLLLFDFWRKYYWNLGRQHGAQTCLEFLPPRHVPFIQNSRSDSSTPFPNNISSLQPPAFSKQDD